MNMSELVTELRAIRDELNGCTDSLQAAEDRRLIDWVNALPINRWIRAEKQFSERHWERIVKENGGE